MNKKLIFGLIFIMLLSVQTISAVKPVIVSSGGLDIIYPSFEHYEQGEDIDFYWHVLNETKLLTNTTVNCSFHLYEKGQEHGYYNNNTMNFIHGRDFEVEVDGGNFTNATEYCRLIECNTATEVGAIESCFTVNKLGLDFNSASAITYLGLFGILIFLFVSTFFGIGLLPAKNEKDEEGKIMTISYLKYFRNILWLFEWMLLLAILYLGSNVAFAYLGGELAAKILFNISMIMLAVTPVIIVVWVVWIFASMFHDKEMQSLINRGIFPQGDKF